jgi:flagella basal body P-ring formation protein FlgA
VIPPERLLEAMHQELPGAHIEILEASRMPAPAGDLIFPLAGLQQTSSGGYWNGYVAYAGKQRFTVWARVKIRVTVQRVTAFQALPAGAPVAAAQLRLETRDEMPARGFAAAVEEIAGRVPKRLIAAGATLRPEWFEAAKAVLRGEPVQVEVTQGAAHLTLEGIAEASGVVGDTIPVQNPISHQRFPARIAARGKVVVKGTS